MINTLLNYFPSNGVATDPITVSVWVVLTQLNTEFSLAQMYFFKTKINLSECYKMEISSHEKYFLKTCLLKLITARSFSLKIGVKIMKSIPNHKA